METKQFELKGTILENKQEKPFTKIVTAVNESYAKEKLVSLFGSKNRLKRTKIKIKSIAEHKEK